MSLERVLDTARAELGYTESPPGSNRTKYWAEYDPTWQGQPWCVAGLWWVFRHSGESKAFFGGAKTASCSILYRWFREQGQEIPIASIAPGDLIFLNFSGTQALQHVALVERVVGNGWYRTLEFNTSPGLEGSQDNGGCVAEKARHKKNIVKAVRPVYGEEKKTDYDGHWAKESIAKAVRKGIVKGYEDGTFRPDQSVTRAELTAILDRLGVLD